jgi:fumarate hydratase class I
MPTPPFVYQDPFPLGEDSTEYRLLSREGVSTATFEGREILKVEPGAIAFLAQQAFHDTSFMLRRKHLEQVAAILQDTEASANDRYVALTLLKNAEIAAKGILPMCQDTGTAAVFAKKGQQVWTGANDAEWISKGVYECFTKENLRYSQTAPLDMWKEVNTGTNLPAQIDVFATEGANYEFVFVAKGGGSANKLFLFQETKAVLNPKSFEKFVADKLPLLGTSACPPYHLVFVVGGTSAEACMKTVKLASTKYLDSLPTTGNEHGRAFRDLAMEAKVLEIARSTGIGAQFGGNILPSTCGSSGSPAMAPAAPSAWASPAVPTATSRARSPRRASSSNRWRPTPGASSRRRRGCGRTTTSCGSTSTSR